MRISEWSSDVCSSDLGKPVGFKFCMGHPWEWFAIVKAMLKTGITPDFIVIDGAEGGTGAAPVEFLDHVGTPLLEALRLVHNTLIGVNLQIGSAPYRERVSAYVWIWVAAVARKK